MAVSGGTKIISARLTCTGPGMPSTLRHTVYSCNTKSGRALPLKPPPAPIPESQERSWNGVPLVKIRACLDKCPHPLLSGQARGIPCPHEESCPYSQAWRGTWESQMVCSGPRPGAGTEEPNQGQDHAVPGLVLPLVVVVGLYLSSQGTIPTPDGQQAFHKATLISLEAKRAHRPSPLASWLNQSTKAGANSTLCFHRHTALWEEGAGTQPGCDQVPKVSAERAGEPG